MQSEHPTSVHRSVLYDEILEWLAVPSSFERNFSLLFDGTLGGGGHSSGLLRASPRVFVVGTDCDSGAVERTRVKLEEFSGRSYLVQGGYQELEGVLAAMPSELKDRLTQDGASTFPRFQGMLLDLGISSDQLDDPARGFSFRHDSPLDMRMSRDSGPTAADLLNNSSEQELRMIFLRGGVSRPLHAILAKEILRRRPFETTTQFAELCRELERRPRKKQPGTGNRNPATVPFQALRIEVNHELEKLEHFLEQVPDYLAPGGRLAVISFHSSEDKAVTQVMRRWSRRELTPFAADEPKAPFGALLTKQAIFPQEKEIAENPRSRSARLRVFERSNKQSIQ